MDQELQPGTYEFNRRHLQQVTDLVVRRGPDDPKFATIDLTRGPQHKPLTVTVWHVGRSQVSGKEVDRFHIQIKGAAHVLPAVIDEQTPSLTVLTDKKD